MSYAETRPTGWPALVRALVVLTGLVLMVSQSQYLQGETAVDFARWFLLGLLCLMLAFRPPKRVKVRRLRIEDGIFGAFFVLVFTSVIYTSSVAMTVQRGVSIVLLYVAVFWTLWYYADLEGEEKLVNTVILTGSIVFIASALSFFITDSSISSRGRFQGILANPNGIGMLAIIFLPLVLSRFVQKRRILDLALIALIIVSVVFSGSRNGVLTASVSLLFLLWRTRAWKPAIVLGVVATVLILIMPESSAVNEGEARPELTRLIAGETKSVTSGRTEAWQVALPIIGQRLLLGHGFGTEDKIFEGVTFRIHRGLYVHNSYLGMAYQLGIIGAALLFIPLLLLTISRAAARRTTNIHAAGFEAVVFGGLVASLFESWVYSVGNAFAFPFWICVMLAIRSGRIPPVRLPATAKATRTPFTVRAPAPPRVMLPRPPRQPARFDPPLTSATKPSDAD